MPHPKLPVPITNYADRDNLDHIIQAIRRREQLPEAAATAIETYIRVLSERIAVLESENASLRAGQYERQGDPETLTVSAGNGHYTRQQPRIVREWVCSICGARHWRVQLPGNTPKYCPGAGDQPSACQREAVRRRVERHRANKRAEQAETNYAQPVTEPQPETVPTVPLPDYTSIEVRGFPPSPLHLTDTQRMVLATVAAGLKPSKDKARTITTLIKKKLIALDGDSRRWEYKFWRLTQHGLKVVRGDEALLAEVDRWQP